MITVVGEALLDLVAQRDRPASSAASFAAHPGGSPANVAVGLARLGTPVTLATQLGDDLPGRMVLTHLENSGVVVEHLPARTAATSLALAAVDESGVASYDFRIAWDILQGPALSPDCRGLHFGSIAAALEPGAAALEELVAAQRRSESQVVISLDPNIRPSLLGPREAERERVERQVSQSDIVKVSSEDLDWLYPGADPRDVGRAWLAAGPALVVVTLGAEGAFGLTRTAETHRSARTIAVVDTVGAGDAFTAGLLDGLRQAGMLGSEFRAEVESMTRASLEGLLGFAVDVATANCGRPGADPPTESELRLLQL